MYSPRFVILQALGSRVNNKLTISLMEGIHLMYYLKIYVYIKILMWNQSLVSICFNFVSKGLFNAQVKV